MSSINEALSAADKCWHRAAEHAWRSSTGLTPSAIATAARTRVEEALFLSACRERGLLADLPFEQLHQSAVDRFGSALFQLEPEEDVCTVRVEGISKPGQSCRVPGNDRSDCPEFQGSGPPLRYDPGTLGVVSKYPPDTNDTFSPMAGLRIEPDSLGPIHHRLLCLNPRPDARGRFQLDRCKTSVKNSGVFYTPDYVTRYMVSRAIESLQKDPSKRGCITVPKIVDPACGCGAFLLAAYRHLRDQVRANANRVSNTDWRRQRRQIIEQLHGVDLDGEAVLVARRALWLEAACEPLGPMSTEETNLLFKTIRQGNALVGPTLESHDGTFDLVLGNPPYRRERGSKRLLEQIAQTDFGRRWQAARMDLWYYFAHRALELLRDEGIVSLIVSRYWTAGSGAAKLVEQLRRETHVEEIFDLDRLHVFDQVAGRHMIFRARKTRNQPGATCIRRPQQNASGSAEPFLYSHIPAQASAEPFLYSHIPAQASAEPFLDGRMPAQAFEKTADELFRNGRIDLEPVDHGLLEAIARHAPLGQLGQVRQGIAENPATVTRQTVELIDHGQVGQGVFVLTNDEVDSLGLDEHEKTLLRPYQQPRDVGRYYLADQASRTLIYSTSQTCPHIGAFATIERHLTRFRPIMEARRETRLGRRPWWQLHWPRDAALWTADKILSVQMAPRPAFVVASRPIWVNFSVNVFVPHRATREHLLYLTALLNSRLIWQWFRHHAKRRGVGLEINGRALAQTPIRRIDFSNATERRMHDKLVELAGEITQRTSTTSDRNDCQSIEGRIDTMVERLYGLHDSRQMDSRGARRKECA